MSSQSSVPQKADSDDIRRRELKRLVEAYALRTRELSEAVAILGGQITTEKQIGPVVLDIKRLHAILEEAAAALFAFVERDEPGRFSASNSGRQGSGGDER